MFNESFIQSSDSEDPHFVPDEVNHGVNHTNNLNQNFGLGYWINHTTAVKKPLLSHHAPDKPANISLPTRRINTKESSLYISHEKKQKSRKKRSSDNYKNTVLESTKLIKKKLSKDVNKMYFKTISPDQSPECSHSIPIKIDVRHSTSKSQSHQNSPRKNRSSPVNTNINCLSKSFKSKYQPLVATNDIMSLSLTIDCDVYHEFSNRPKLNQYLTYDDKMNRTNPTESSMSDNKSISTLYISESKYDRLSLSCDKSTSDKISLDKCHHEADKRLLVPIDSNGPSVINIKKRCNYSPNDDVGGVVSSKRKPTISVSENEDVQKNNYKEERGHEMTAIDFVKLQRTRMKTYESDLFERHCLSQPNAMKFLAQHHATNWELNKNDSSQIHLVPWEFLNEIFHRALYCFGLEKKIVTETMSGNSSPMMNYCSPHSAEYKKIRDEYSFSLKRVRYGLGVIDEFFSRKVHSHTQNSDVVLARKYKHIIYYICLHTKSAFMAKEIQYHNYVLSAPGTFDGFVDLWTINNFPTLCLSNFTLEKYYKASLTCPLPSEISSMFDVKGSRKMSPDHCSQSDLEISPHSYDSGKGSSVTLSSNNGAGQTTSSLNSTPHSLQETEPHSRGLQLFRIDEYQRIAHDYVRLLPDATQLHDSIVAITGCEPNANSRDSVLKLIYYIDVCQQISRQHSVNDCLQRLASRVLT